MRFRAGFLRRHARWCPVVVLILVALAACGQEQSRPEQAQPTPPVETTIVDLKDVDVYDVYDVYDEYARPVRGLLRFSQSSVSVITTP